MYVNCYKIKIEIFTTVFTKNVGFGSQIMNALKEGVGAEMRLERLEQIKTDMEQAGYIILFIYL